MSDRFFNEEQLKAALMDAEGLYRTTADSLLKSIDDGVDFTVCIYALLMLSCQVSLQMASSRKEAKQLVVKLTSIAWDLSTESLEERGVI